MTPKTLEERLDRLEQIVSELGRGERTLQEMLALYSEGMRISQDCTKQLAEARQVVEQGKTQTEE